MSNRVQVRRAKNGRAARRINKLFGARAQNSNDDPSGKRYFAEMKLPVFYETVNDIPNRSTGVFVVWNDAQPWNIDYSIHCIKTKIEKLFSGKEIPYVFSIISFPHGAGSTAKALCRLLMETFRPPMQYERQKKAPNWDKLAQRFWAKVKLTGGGKAPGDLRMDNHAIWTGAKSNGYGVFSMFGKVTTARRVAYILARGSIPFGAQIRHMKQRCQEKLCCNPFHLRLVTGKSGAHYEEPSDMATWQMCVANISGNEGAE